MPRAFAACQTVELGSEIRAAGSVTRRAFGGRQSRVAQRERVKAPVVSGDPVLTEHTEPAPKDAPDLHANETARRLDTPQAPRWTTRGVRDPQRQDPRRLVDRSAWPLVRG